ncbi:MAG TPA: glycosyltransferase family 4 protein [Candidatus Sulfotelmatobacter sp.]|nr:glycosyltransferase family 4 protein [Candidatus Sulfotelmatobacter sp.]
MSSTGQNMSGGAREMHVLTLTPFYPTEKDDAIGCFVSEPLAWFAKAGVAKGVHNTVFAVQPIYRAKPRPSASAVPAEWLQYFSLPGGLGLPSAGAFLFARLVGRVRKLHASQPVDLIHAHAPLPCGHAAKLLSAELNIPYAVSVHGLDAFSTVQVPGRAGEWSRRVSRRVYRSSRRVICISERVREAVLEGTAGSCRTSVVYNGVDPELFSPAANSSSAAPIILSVGNLIPTKGHAVLIRAAAALAPEFPTLQWEIIGEGPEHDRLQKLCTQLQIADKVRFLGRQSRKQVAVAMQRSTLFALPSSYEGLGCVYLEAMSTGKPAIGCRGQGIAEVIQHGSNGFLVGPDNDRELALAIAMLLKDETRRQNISRAARDTILDRFTLARQAESLARIYREAAE